MELKSSLVCFWITLLAFFLKEVMGKFKRAVNNDMQKFFIDQLKHATDRIDGKGQESLKEVGPEAFKCNLELILIRIEYF